MKLYPFQETGRDFLLGDNRRYLADDMGTGKTIQAASAAEQLNPKSVLVITPASSMENWRREWEEWGQSRQPDIISYADPKLANLTKKYELVIPDEAHYCKTKTANRTLAALRQARKAERSWLLSGTPMPNHPGELWAPIRALWPHIPEALNLKDHSAWFNHFCEYHMGNYGPVVHRGKNLEALRPYLKQIMLRRKWNEVGLQMPPLRIDLSLLPRNAAFRKAIAEAGFDAAVLEQQMDIEDTEYGSSSRLRRILGQYKAPFIGSLIAEELEQQQYDQVVVLAYHHNTLDTLRTALYRFGIAGFDGRTATSRRQEEVDKFTAGKARVFLAQQTSAGISINLQCAHEIVLVEPAWSPDDNRQAIFRVVRIGQKHAVRARIFAVADSLDEAVMGRVVEKARIRIAAGL